MTAFRKLLTGAAFAVAMTGLSLSANAQNWGGLYVGANAGWIGKDFDWAFNPAIPGAVNQAYSLSADDTIVGGHIGIQHQWSNFVVGVEAAYSGSVDNDFTSRPRYGVGSGDSLVSLGNIFTIGPRLGWAPNNQWLLFVGGGYAGANIKTAGRIPATGVLFNETSQFHDGWYVGGGVEFAITRNIIFGVEYQRIDLDTKLHCVNSCVPSDTNNHDMSATADIVRARLSFKLGRPDDKYESLK